MARLVGSAAVGFDEKQVILYSIIYIYIYICVFMMLCVLIACFLHAKTINNNANREKDASLIPEIIYAAAADQMVSGDVFTEL